MIALAEILIPHLTQGYVFVDIKPDNFMIKRIDGNDKLFFIDFGLMEKVTGYRSGGAQREETHRATVAGTVAYVSLGVHRGGTPSRRDDLEAMAYVLLAITSPDCALPWLGPHIRSDADCLAVKESTDMNSVCHAQGCPQVRSANVHNVFFSLTKFIFSWAIS